MGTPIRCACARLGSYLVMARLSNLNPALIVEGASRDGFGLKGVLSHRLAPNAAMTHLCPYRKKSELLLVSETTDAVGKRRYRYKCPRCGATWPF